MLTADTDSFVGTANNDLFEATNATLQAADRITDVSTTDNDVMNVVLTASPVAMDVTNVETINLDWDAYGTPAIDLDNVTGATVKLSSDKSGYLGKATFTNVGSNNIELGAGITGAVTVDAMEDATMDAGLASKLTMTTADGSLNVTANSASNISIDSGDDLVLKSTAMETLALGATTALKTADVTFSKDTNMTLSNVNSTELTLSSTEDVTVSVIASAAAAANYAEIITLAGDNAVTLSFDTMANLAATEVVNGGAIIVEGAFATADLTAVASETITFETANAGTAAITTVDGAHFVLEENAAQLVEFLNAEDAVQSITVTSEVSQSSLDFDGAGNGATDTTKDFETVTLISDAEVVANTAATINYDITYTAILANENKVVFESAVNDIDVTAITAKEVDASAVVNEFKMVQVAGAAAADMMVVGGASDNDVTFTATTGDSTFIASEGSTGDDSVTFATTTGEAVAILGEGDNEVTASADIAGAGQLTVVAGSGDDTVTANSATTGTLSINLGDGKNTFSATALTAGTVEYTGGAGVDTVTIGAGTTLLAATVTLNLGDGDNVATAVLSGAAVTDLTITAGAGDDSVTLTTVDNSNDKVNLDLGAGENTLNISHDIADLDLTIANVDVIAIGANAANANVSAALLNGAAYEITGQGTAGASDTLKVEMKADLDEVDFSGIVINDTLTKGIAGLNISGVDGEDNVIIATSGADTIAAGTGENTITGGKGADTITLGAGKDTVVITAASDLGTGAAVDAAGDSAAAKAATDTLITFGDGTDLIDISALSNISSSTVVDDDTGTGAAHAATALGNILVVQDDDTAGDAIVYINTDGGTTASFDDFEVAIYITGGASMTWTDADFVLA